MSGLLKRLLDNGQLGSATGFLADLGRLHRLSISLLDSEGQPCCGPETGSERQESLKLALGEPGQEPLGWLRVCPPPRGPQAAQLRSLLAHLAGWLSQLCQGESEMDSIARELSCRYEEINLMFRLGEHLRVLGAGGQPLRNILEESVAALECDLILLCLPAAGIFEQAGPTRLDPSRLSPRALVSCLSQALEANGFLVTVGAAQGRLWEALGLATTSSIIFPVKVKDRREGLLACLSFGEQVFTSSKVNLMRALSAQISIVLTNDKLIQTMKDFLLEVVGTLVSAIEAKDEYTRGHSERVQEISLAIGEALGLEPALMEELRWAGILHDIGKIGIPDTILRKPGRLTEEEFAEIKKHPQRGVNILKHLGSLSAILPAILHHHERLDGRGYPAGLAGEAIPLLARIIAVGDTFDAITSTRAYRAARSPAEALAEIERVAGDQLDAEIVKIFARLCRQRHFDGPPVEVPPPGPFSGGLQPPAEP